MLRVTILSAHNVPRPAGWTGSKRVFEPYVHVRVYGAPQDNAKRKTKHRSLRPGDSSAVWYSCEAPSRQDAQLSPQEQPPAVTPPSSITAPSASWRAGPVKLSRMFFRGESGLGRSGRQNSGGQDGTDSGQGLGPDEKIPVSDEHITAEMTGGDTGKDSSAGIVSTSSLPPSPLTGQFRKGLAWVQEASTHRVRDSSSAAMAAAGPTSGLSTATATSASTSAPKAPLAAERRRTPGLLLAAPKDSAHSSNVDPAVASSSHVGLVKVPSVFKFI